MLTAFSIFRLSNVLYQIIATFFVYWLHICSSSFPALFREWIWFLFIFIAIILWFRNIRPYRKIWKQVWISFIILIVVSILFSILKSHTWFNNIFIWIKYWFWRTFILISASFFGFSFSEKFKKSKIFQVLPRTLVWIVFFGFFRQWAKLLRPDFFYSLWYGRLNDYSFWSNPPIYYLTSFEWTLRWQWLFSGPNNYWYFLVAFLPLIWRFFTENIKKKEKSKSSIIALVIWFAWMIATLSRAVLVWMVVVFIIIYRKQLRQKKNLILLWWIWLLISLIVLSVLKRESTIWHITSKFETIPEIISAPLGHWLGSSGPAIHHEWKYLPENYYLQIMLDIWTVGFLFWVISIMYLMYLQYKVINSHKLNPSNKDELEFLVFHKLQIWLLSLFVIWLFLHVFEDSMVNYLFFTIYWILLWSLSKNLKGELSLKEVLEQNKNLR